MNRSGTWRAAWPPALLAVLAGGPPGGVALAGVEFTDGAGAPGPQSTFTQTVTNTHDSSAGSLRSAVTQVIAHGGGAVTFAIGSGCGPHVITLATPLPAVTVPLVVNGWTQPGAQANDLPVGDEARRCIAVNTDFRAVANAFKVPAGAGDGVALTVIGLVFGGFDGAAIELGAGRAHRIAGNDFCLTYSPFNQNAIRVDANAHDATIGGVDPADHNLINCSVGSGIAVFGGIAGGQPSGSHGNRIIGNLVGVAWSGDENGQFVPYGNLGRGLYIAGHDNEISGNWIGSNEEAGILLTGGGAQNNTIEHNTIGVETAFDLGNGNAGIHLTGAANDAPTANVIRYNTISANGAQGVWIERGRYNRTRQNSIFANGGLGIDLAAAGVLANDPDAAPQPPDYANRGQNYPLLSDAVGDLQSGRFTGSLSSSAGDYRVDFYQTPGGCDGDERQGEYWIASVPVAMSPHASDGVAAIDVMLHGGDLGHLEPGAGITATATTGASGAGDTSEFSACIAYRSAAAAQGFAD